MSDTTLPAFAKTLRAILNAPGSRGRKGIATIVWGPPGAGKTSLFEAIAAEEGWPFECVLGSIREPADVSGLPVLSPDGTAVWLAPPAWAKRLVEKCGDGRGGLLLLDELSSCPGAVQAALLRVLTEGVVGETVLPPSVRIVAAANPPEQAAGGWGLAPPTANRLVHLNWDGPSAAEWATWITGQSGLDPRVRAGIGALIVRRPELLLALPKSEADRGFAWPSPRSWESAARVLAAVKAANLGDGVALQVLAGAVGDGAAKEAWSYFSELDLPDPEEFLSGGREFQIDPERGDKTHAILGSIVSAALDTPPGPRRAERALHAVEICGEVAEKGAADAAVVHAGRISRATKTDSDLQTMRSDKKLKPRFIKAFSGKLASLGKDFEDGKQQARV